MSTFHGFIRRWFHGFRSFLFRVFQIIGNALISGVVLAIIIGGTTYAMTGTKMLPNFLSSGVDFISFFSDTGTGNVGVDAKSFYARSNGSWIGYPADNYNYLRNHTFLSGSLIDENNNNYYMNPDGTTNLNQLCLNGVCKNTWPASTSGGIVTGALRWSDEYSGQNYEQSWATCLALLPTNTWRLPEMDEIEYARHINGGLFTGNQWYWSSIFSSNAINAVMTWGPNKTWWLGCGIGATTCSNGSSGGGPMVFRCVSNS